MKSGNLRLQKFESARLPEQVRKRVPCLHDEHAHQTDVYWARVRLPQPQPAAQGCSTESSGDSLTHAGLSEAHA
jgi:hypothetical protein